MSLLGSVNIQLTDPNFLTRTTSVTGPIGDPIFGSHVREEDTLKKKQRKKIDKALKLVFEWNQKSDAICKVCHAPRGMDNFDACLLLLPPECLTSEGGLKGVTAACCGHGEDDEPDSRYAVTITGRDFRGIGAFRQHQRWLATPEAQMSLICDPVLMGWRRGGNMRMLCTFCILPYSECTCWIWKYSKKKGHYTVQRRK